MMAECNIAFSFLPNDYAIAFASYPRIVEPLHNNAPL
jgi:hypothetical protein